MSAWKAFVVKTVALNGGRYDRCSSRRTCIGSFLSIPTLADQWDHRSD